MSIDALFCHCRPGFEPELAAELAERAAVLGHAGYPRANRGDGYVEYVSDDAAQLARRLPFDELIFARQKLLRLADLRSLDPKDRISPVIAALEANVPVRDGAPFGELWVEHPDSDTARPLSGLARSFGNALRPALRKAGWLSAREDSRRSRLHVVFLAGDHAVLGRSHPGDSAPWPQGIPRLRMHADAPSRSALKLEEALMTLLDDGERERLLRDGLRGADLGAAPGGWTWVMLRHGLHMIAIDNGPMRTHLFDTGRLEHLRVDGFRWQPESPLDWMVCDMVEQPRRVASRMADWLREGWCTQTVFNLKLPMKKRWEETRACLELFQAEVGRPLVLKARQLYHDREEITVFARPR